MEFKEIQLQLVLLFHFGLQIAYGVPTLSASITPPVPVKGNNSYTVICSYTTGNDETVQYVNLYRGTELIITHYPFSNITVWSPTVNDAFKQRVTKFGSLSTNVVGITYSNTLCSDEVSYKCDVNVVSAGSISLTVSNSTTVSTEAPPKAPVQMTVNPNFQSIQEFTNVTFTCSGNVGKPAGTFHWYMFTAANGVNPDNVTLQASTESPVPASSDCTFTRRSSLTIRLLRKYTGLVVRCRVYHPTQVNNANPTDCTDSSAQFCQSSQNISVTYPVNVTVDTAFRQEVEGNMMSLTCKPEANPKAWLEWFKSDSSVTLSNNELLIFNRLTLADSGDYTCIGYNNISGVIYNASASVSVTVVPTTTPPPTTMRATTHSSTGLDIAYGVPTITASFTPPVPVKGNNNKHSVMCSYITGSGETISYVTLTRGTELIITLTTSNITYWSPTVTDAFKQRASKFGSLSTNVVGVTYSNTLCGDEVSYKCDIIVSSGESALPSVSSTTAVSIEAPPQTPVQMIINPNFQSIQEFTNVTFTCSGNVGKPAGTFYWYMFTAANGINPDNITLQASTESPVSASGDCTFTRRSSLTIRLLRKHTDLVVRCRVYHPTQVNNANPTDCTNSSAQFCQSSQNISVTYPVNVTVDSAIRQEVEGNIMILTCKPEANPEAWLEWFKSDSNVPLSNSSQLIFTRLTLADSGDYTCMGYNNISGVIYNASASVSVTVVPTTTPPKTTTIRTSMRATTHSNTDSVVTGKQTTTKETASAQCITPDSLLGQGIGIGVGVTLAFTIIVHTLVFIIWKWRHKQKPSGLNDPSINEDCSTRSRSVGDGDYSYYSDIHSNSYDSLRTQEMNLSSYYSALNASNNDRNNR